MDEYATLLDYFLAIDGYNFDENLKYILDGLNLKEDVNFKVGILSAQIAQKITKTSNFKKNISKTTFFVGKFGQVLL